MIRRQPIQHPRIIRPAVYQHVVEAVQTITATSITVEEINLLMQVSVDAEQQNLEPAQVEEAIRERTPFEVLLQILPKDRTELYAFLALVVAVLQLVVAMRPPGPPQTMTPEQVEQVIERVLDHGASVTTPPTSTAPAQGSSTTAPTSTAPAPTSTEPPHCEDHGAR
jgi:hypothetical protein